MHSAANAKNPKPGITQPPTRSSFTNISHSISEKQTRLARGLGRSPVDVAERGLETAGLCRRFGGSRLGPWHVEVAELGLETAGLCRRFGGSRLGPWHVEVAERALETAGLCRRFGGSRLGPWARGSGGTGAGDGRALQALRWIASGPLGTWKWRNGGWRRPGFAGLPIGDCGRSGDLGVWLDLGRGRLTIGRRLTICPIQVLRVHERT